MTHDLTLDIATARTARTATWRNGRTTWSALATRLAETKRTGETVEQYAAMPRDQQGHIKDVGGFVGGYLHEGRRRQGDVVHRQVITLDVDHAADGFEQWDNFLLLSVAGVMYTTHKHRPGASRYRIVVPLDRPAKPDEYEAAARVLASWLGIDAFDDTTYQPVRLMYWPSTPADGEFVYDCVDAPPLRVDEALAALADWRDPTTWPTSARTQDTVSRQRSDKAEDPLSKEGIVGAFCRAYTVPEAIAEFLSGVYSPSEHAGRYTYTGGSTEGGLVVYDDVFAYSHHSTDPAGGRLCNAFDLVRLHRFGGLDAETPGDMPPNRLPSYKAMTALAAEQTPVKLEIAEQRRAAADEYDTPDAGAPPTAAPDTDPDAWLGTVELDRRGAFKNTIDNVVKILTNDAGLAGRFGFNEFEQREVAVRALPWDRPGGRYPRPLCDSDDAELRLYLERLYSLSNRSVITDGLTVAVRAHSFNPVRDYLDACEWDGVERLDTLLIDMFRAEDTPYVRAVTRKAFTAAVARAVRPGCKFDYVLVLAGPEGIRKSTLLDRMGRQWFTDSMPAITGKEAMEQIQGSWIVELGELAGLRKAETESVKHFISKREDRFRVAYGKRVEFFPRRCVFFGTTNEADFLRSATGNRRFWVVDCHADRPTDYPIDDERVAQLWAEAKYRHEQGEVLYLPDDLEAAARDVQDAHLERDERNGLVGEYLERLLPDNWGGMDLPARRAWLADGGNVGTQRRERVCVAEIWAECFGRDVTMISRRDGIEVGRILRSLRGWEMTGTRRVAVYGAQKIYERRE
ncbi:virulence-associated E family protein [uncultured Alistipes sp.]|uniref:virulence-associated E family protein n=1 Tax=uncultured Alistipes sp. TaxID=538949 RepID=UPI002658D703|nr:virulence-associated E family protein [uncultured Alistipes sp.]